MAGRRALTLNEVLERVFHWSPWKWPREHRWKAVALLLVIAQIGVNSNLKSELRATTEAAHEEAVRLHEVATSLENNRKSLEARISEKDKQIIDLQLAAIGAPIRVGVDLSGVVPLEPPSQPPAYDSAEFFLGGDAKTLVPFSADYIRRPVTNYRDVTIDWPVLSDFTVHVEVTGQVSMSKSGGSATLYLSDMANKITSVLEWRVPLSSFPMQAKKPEPSHFRQLLPKSMTKSVYRLNVVGNEGMALWAHGKLIVARRHPS